VPYIFPKRKLRDTDVLDPQEMNADLQPAGEKYSGRLNEHDFASDAASDTGPAGNRATVQRGAMWGRTGTVVGVNPDMGNPSSYQLPQVLSNFPPIPSDGQWHQVPNTSVTVGPTGEARLWIIATAQYFIMKGASTLDEFRPLDAWDPVQVQLALRVNGHVLPDSVTGRYNPLDKTIEAWRPANQRFFSVSPPYPVPGPQPDYLLNTGALGPAAASVRLMSFYHAPPGRHTVDIVARRLPRHNDITDVAVEGVLFVYNSQIEVLDFPIGPQGATTFDSVDVGAFETEDVVSAQAMDTARLDPLREAYNKVQPGALGRGAFNHNHLRSPVINTDRDTLETGVAYTIQSAWPGYDQDTYNTTPTGTGWFPARDSTGDILSVGPFTVSEDCAIVVFADVEMIWVGTGRTSIANHTDHFAAFCLMRKVGGSLVQDAWTETYFHQWNASSNDLGRAGARINVPLFQILRYGDGQPNALTDDPTWIRVGVAGIHGGGSEKTAPGVHINRCSLKAIQLRLHSS